MGGHIIYYIGRMGRMGPHGKTARHCGTLWADGTSRQTREALWGGLMGEPHAAPFGGRGLGCIFLA